MNDQDLQSKLKSVPLPERSEEYWDDFPASVRRQLHRERYELVPQRMKHPRLARAAGLAAAFALVFACIQFHPLKTASIAITNHERQFHAQLAQLDAGLHVLMFNPHGMGYLLAEAN